MLYDYKSKNKVQEVLLECICPIVEDIADEFDRLHRFHALTVFAPSWLGRMLLVEILKTIDEVYISEESSIDLLEKDDNEILFTVAWDGCIIIEEARGNKGQLKTGTGDDLIYIYDDFYQHDLNRLREYEEYIMIFGLVDENVYREENVEYDFSHCESCRGCDTFECDARDCDGCEKNMELDDFAIEHDSDMHGFTVSKTGDDGYYTMSYYSSEMVDMNDTIRILKELGFDIM